jgi:CheY-like chemotaxis protein
MSRFGVATRTSHLSQTGPGSAIWPRIVRSKDDGQSGAETSASPGRVLIVEDEYLVALTAEDALLDAGYTVVGIAASAEEAVKLAEVERPDLVLMDIRLVGQRDGIDAAAEIRARFGIFSLFATAYSDPATRTRGDAAASPLGWLAKPYPPTALTDAVAEAIAKVKGSGGSGGP